jgi:hypothetical protein
MRRLFDVLKPAEISRSGQPTNKGEPPVQITGADINADTTKLNIIFSSSFKAELFSFLEHKGYLAFGQETKGIAQLLRYGLSEKNRSELEKNKSELDLSQYAGMRFELYQCYQDNNTVTLGLSMSLAENRKLKQALRTEGLDNLVPQDDWDNWDDRFIKTFFQRYVFGRQE